MHIMFSLMIAFAGYSGNTSLVTHVGVFEKAGQCREQGIKFVAQLEAMGIDHARAICVPVNG